MIELNVYDKKRNFQFPKKDKFLAEFFGILTGDGYINQYRLFKRIVSNMEISGNKVKDLDYMKNYVANLITKLFNIKPNIYFRNDNTIRVIIYSKALVLFLNKLEFPLGNKGNISPPIWVTSKDDFFKSFVRGFFDTDGHLTLKNKGGKKYPVIGLASKSKPLLLSFQEFLKSLDISSYFGTRIVNDPRFKTESICYKLEINGKRNLRLFFKHIGSNNIRNLKKYKEFLSIKN